MKIRVPGKPVGFLKITLKCTQKVTFERRWLRFVTYFKSNIDLLCISIKTGIFIIRQIYFRCPLPLHTYHHDQLMNVSFFFMSICFFYHESIILFYPRFYRIQGRLIFPFKCLKNPQIFQMGNQSYESKIKSLIAKLILITPWVLLEMKKNAINDL